MGEPRDGDQRYCDVDICLYYCDWVRNGGFMLKRAKRAPKDAEQSHSDDDDDWNHDDWKKGDWKD